MDHSSTEAGLSGNGAASTVAGAVPSPVTQCPLNDLPEEVHQYIHGLEQRVAKLESEQKRFTDALLNAGKFIFDNPASKIMLAAFPKEAQQKLRDFFNAAQ